MTNPNPVEPVEGETVEIVTRYENGKKPELYMVNGKLVAPQANTEQLDEILEQNIIVDLRTLGTHPEYLEATMGLKKLKADLLAWNKATVIEELQKLSNSSDNMEGLIYGVTNRQITDRIQALKQGGK